MNETLSLPLYNVTVDRGSTVIPVVVPRHEVDVLRAVHGVAEVQIVGEADEEIALDSSADTEWARLTRKYRRMNSPDPVGIAFRTGPSQLEAHGFSLRRSAAAAAPQASIRDHKKEAKAAAKAAAKTDKKAADKAA